MKTSTLRAIHVGSLSQFFSIGTAVHLDFRSHYKMAGSARVLDCGAGVASAVETLRGSEHCRSGFGVICLLRGRIPGEQ